ncbi:hypothetical protein MUG78_03910 [Gordonia alkaliphila]|uniref:hypothetical protein n=1 Tax=Gordonia alkaliphila TaxID=1053547 RepID=UPI001FF177E5|nr:hypothetical protein [Gordonia alkaliphila]MCK0438633.1 hypothetical protein [Gordonia alkaliphila]
MGKWTFTMGITDTTPKVGDEITISNTLSHSQIDRYVYRVKQVVPKCLDFVSANGSGTIASTQNTTGTDDSFVLVNAPTGGWRINGPGQSVVKVNVVYKVTDACATGNAQQAVMHMGGSTIGDRNFNNNPISFTVAKPSTGGGDNGGGDNGGGDNGGGDNGGGDNGGGDNGGGDNGGGNNGGGDNGGGDNGDGDNGDGNNGDGNNGGGDNGDGDNGDGNNGDGNNGGGDNGGSSSLSGLFGGVFNGLFG